MKGEWDMTEAEDKKKMPLWLAIEERFLTLDPQALSGGKVEAAIQQMAGELDQAGYNVSRHGGHMIELRFALKDMLKAGRPLLKDVNAAVEALTLEEATAPYAASDRIVKEISKAWPKFGRPEFRPEVIRRVEKARLDLLIAKAKGMPGDEGIELLIEQMLAFPVILSGLGITEERLAQVDAEMKRRAAERERVAALLEAVKGKTDPERVKHLFDNNVAEKLIMEMAKVDQGVIDGVKKAMEEALKEKERQEAEAAARRKAEAEGPPLEALPPAEMLAYIESIREIMEFSDKESEIRTMCEQSKIPKALIDIAVSEPAKLDELEQAAQG
jgi:hypothetical protein